MYSQFTVSAAPNTGSTDPNAMVGNAAAAVPSLMAPHPAITGPPMTAAAVPAPLLASHQLPVSLTHRQVPTIETLPTEIVAEIIRRVHPVDIFALKLAGSRFINEVVRRHCSTIPFGQYKTALEGESYRRGAWQQPRRSALHLAAARGHISLMVRLLRRTRAIAPGMSRPPPVQTQGYLFRHWNPMDLQLLVDGKTALHWAAEYGHDDAVQMLLDLGASAATLVYHGRGDLGLAIPVRITPLHLAVVNNHQSTVGLLLNKVTALSTHLQDLLSWAAYTGQVSMVRFLLSRGAIAPGDTQTALKLLWLRADMEYKANDGKMPWEIALANEHDSMAEMLLGHGAATEFCPQTLSLAAAAGNDACVRVLLDHGAPRDGYFPYGDIYLTGVFSQKVRKEFSAHVDKGWYPVLHEAVGSGQLSAISILLAQGANVNEPTVGALMPLHLAVCADPPYDVKAAELLLDAGAHIDAQNFRKLTTLHLACDSGNHELVKLLLVRGADMEVKDDRGWAPIHHAAAKGYSQTIQELADAGCDVNIKNADGDGPLHLCGRGGHVDAYWILRYRGAKLMLTNNEFRIPETPYPPTSDKFEPLLDEVNLQPFTFRRNVLVYPIGKAINPGDFADLYNRCERQREFGSFVKEKNFSGHYAQVAKLYPLLNPSARLHPATPWDLPPSA